MKVQLRLLIGQLKTSEECERVLNAWCDLYVSGSSSASELQARYPLRGARVRVTKTSTDRARFQCEVLVRPQYQIDNLVGDITLRTDFDVGKEI